MLDRVRGLPVIVEHPRGGTLDGDELAQRIIGTIVFSYVQGDELWGVARVIDQDAARALAALDLMDTSPSVIFRPGENIVLDLDEGDTLLIEGEPSMLDHVAICERGVWSRGTAERGVEIT